MDIVPNLISTFALIIFFVGRFQVKKNIKLHIQLISIAMIIDVILVLALVVMRNALGTVVSGEMGLLLRIHVPIAVLTVVGYGFATYWGLKLKNGDRKYLKHMRCLDIPMMSLRFLNTFTSWLLFIY